MKPGGPHAGSGRGCTPGLTCARDDQRALRLPSGPGFPASSFPIVKQNIFLVPKITLGPRHCASCSLSGRVPEPRFGGKDSANLQTCPFPALAPAREAKAAPLPGEPQRMEPNPEPATAHGRRVHSHPAAPAALTPRSGWRSKSHACVTVGTEEDRASRCKCHSRWSHGRPRHCRLHSRHFLSAQLGRPLGIAGYNPKSQERKE